MYNNLHIAIVYSLESFSNSTGWNTESKSDARSLLLALSQFQVVVALQTTTNVLEYQEDKVFNFKSIYRCSTSLPGSGIGERSCGKGSLRSRNI